LSRRKRAAKYFGEDMGNIEVVIGMNAILCLWLATSDALIRIWFQAGNFEGSVEVIMPLLPYALLREAVLIFDILPGVRADRLYVEAAPGLLPTYCYRPLPGH
jgi:hypothetical protein